MCGLGGICARMKQNGLVSGQVKYGKTRACAGMNIGRLKKVSGFSDGLFFNIGGRIGLISKYSGFEMLYCLIYRRLLGSSFNTSSLE